MANIVPVYHKVEHQETVNAGQTSSPFYIDNYWQPDGVNFMPVQVGLTPTGGASAKVQYSISPAAAVNAGTANWFDWTPGAVTVATAATLSFPVTAVRCAVTGSGSVVFEALI